MRPPATAGGKGKSAALCCPQPKGAAKAAKPGPATDASLAAMAKALGHPARIKILRLLLAKDVCICGDIVLEVGLAQSTVSQHLKVLKQAGFIRGDIDGPKTCYCVERDALKHFKSVQNSLLG